MSFICPLSAQTVAPTDREILLEIVKQQTKLSEQQTTSTLELRGEIKAINMEIKGMQKHIEMLFYLMLGVLAGIFGVIGLIFWGRRLAMTPIEKQGAELKLENVELKKEVNILKEKQLKNESIFKKLIEKYPDLANISY